LQWRLTQNPDGWTIQNVYNGKYLDISGAPENNTEVIAVDTGNPRKWDIHQDEQDPNGWR
jgi:hypothetical protein